MNKRSTYTTTQKISIFQSDHPYSNMSILLMGPHLAVASPEVTKGFEVPGFTSSLIHRLRMKES